MPLTLGVRWQGKTQSIILPDGAGAAELQAAIEERCGVPKGRQQLKGGFPPRPLDLSAEGKSLADLGLRDRDAVVLQEVEPQGEAGAGPACPPPPSGKYAVPAPEAVGELERLVIPADNSCMFNSILTTLSLTDKLKPADLRSVVKAKILADPTKLDAECQADSGRGSVDYAEWICKPDSWGGFIDLHLLADYLGVQICAICIRSLRVESFPNEAAGDARIFLLFDGIHYDCVVAKPAAGGPPFGIFGAKDDMSQAKAIAVALDLKERKQFTDTANFTLQCQHCFKLLTGEADAQQHAKETGHFNFQEAPAAG